MPRLKLAGAAVVALLAAVLCSARLGSLSPFGIAFFYSALQLGAASAAAALGTVIASAVAAPEKGPAVLAAVALGWALAGPTGSERMRHRADMLSAASVLAARLVASGFGVGRAPLWWVETLAEAMLAWSLVRLWRPVVPALLGPGDAQAPGERPAEARRDAHRVPGGGNGAGSGSGPRAHEASRALERAAGLVLGVALTVSGLERFGLGPLQPAAAAMGYLTLVAGATLGSSSAVAVSVASGFLLALADPRWLLYGMLQAAAGLTCAATAGGWRVWPALCLVAITAVGGLAAPSAQWTLWALGHALVAASLFLATPGWVLIGLERRVRAFWEPAWVPAAPATPVGRLAVAWLGQRLTEGIAGAGRVVEALRAAYETAAAGPLPVVPDGPGYVAMVQERACAGCPSFSHCWEAAAQASFVDVMAFLEAAETSGRAAPETMAPSLRQRCIQPVRLSAAVADAARAMAALRSAWRLSQEQTRRLITQVEAARGVLQRVTQMASAHVRAFDAEAAERLTHHLARAGVVAREVVIGGTGARREALVELAVPCPAPETCARRLERLLEECEGVPWTTVEVRCRHGAEVPGGRGCEVHLMRRAVWQVACAFASRPRAGELCSGDSFSRVEPAPALAAVILSDGMGSGPEAARESETAVRLAEAALAAGAGAGGAIQLANAVLLARSPDERFATLDVAVLDLASGELELGKAGAYPTFLVSAAGVERIEGRALPAGIVAGVEVEPIRRPLQDGDVVLMVTDGAAELGEAGEGCLEEALQALRSRTDGPKSPDELLERLMARLDGIAGDQWPDDVTLALITVSQLDVAPVPPYTGTGTKRPVRAAASTGRQRQRQLAR